MGLRKINLRKARFAGFWARFGALFIDGLIFVPLGWIDTLLLYHVRWMPLSVVWSIAYSLASVFYTPWFLARFGQTPGKMVMKIRVVNRRGSGISISRAFLRDVLGLIWWPLGFYWVAVTLREISAGNPAFETEEAAMEWLMRQAGTGLITFLGIWGWGIGLLEITFVLLNKKKRALHDFIADTYVVKLKP